MKTRLNITLSEELLKEIDERANELYISRSAYIATALKQKMQADDAMKMLPELNMRMKEAIELQKGTPVLSSGADDGRSDGGEV